MGSRVLITLYDQISEYKEDKEYNTYEKYRSNFFLNECAYEWHEANIMKVYTAVDQENNKLVGFFSIRASQFDLTKENKEKVYYPILDVTHIDVIEDLNPKTSEFIFNFMLEYVQKIGESVSEKVGCRYIRCYDPWAPKIPGKKTTPENQLYPFLEKLLHKRGFSKLDGLKSRVIKERNKEKKEVLHLIYYVKDLL